MWSMCFDAVTCTLVSDNSNFILSPSCCNGMSSLKTCPMGKSTVGLSSGICHVMFYTGLSEKR